MSHEIETDYIYIAGFDMGLRNFATWIDKYNLTLIKQLKNIPDKKRYNQNKEPTPEFSDLLKKLYLTGERVFVDKVDLCKEGDKKMRKQPVVTQQILVRLTNYLEDLNEKKVFDNVSYFLIEEQLKANPNAQQLSYHLRAYLIMLFLNFRKIIMFPSKYKTQILGAPKLIYHEKKKKMVKLGTKRKKWSSEKVFQILTDRNDISGLADIYAKKKYGKADDTADCCLENLAFVYMYYLDGKNWLLE